MGRRHCAITAASKLHQGRLRAGFAKMHSLLKNLAVLQKRRTDSSAVALSKDNAS